NKLLVSSILEGFYALEFDADHFFIRKTGTGIVTVPQNSSQNYDIELVTLGNFSGQVSLNVIGLPPGATASAKPVETTSKSMSTVTLSINIPANTPVGNYSLIVEGDSPGMDTQRLAVGLVVEADVCANFQSCMPIEYSHSQNNGNTPSPTRPTKPTKSK
ncbi:MAG: hypothetical protein AB8G22_18130, partial [Saprospiraceae bacterium]